MPRFSPEEVAASALKPKNFVDKAELEAEFQKSKADGWKWTERFAELLLQMHKVVLRRPSFHNYGQDFKNDMVQASCLKLFRAMRNYDSSKGDLFPYLHTAIQMNLWNFCLDYYRRENKKSALLYMHLREIKEPDAQARETLERLRQNPYVMKEVQRHDRGAKRKPKKKKADGRQ